MELATLSRSNKAELSLVLVQNNTTEDAISSS